MFNILEALKNNLQRPRPLHTDRINTHMPSRAMIYSALDSKPIGACIRSAYMDIKQYPSSNPMGIYMKMTTEAGKLWEEWVIDQYKQIGIYTDHSVKLYDPTKFISGELDILHYNPITNEQEVTEVKQYNGSNYSASASLTGSGKNMRPAPKDPNLLQVFTYLLMLRNTGNTAINFVNLLYIDRSCGSFSNNFQFRISLTEVSGIIHPLVEYFDAKGDVQQYVDTRITDKALFEKNAMLDAFVENEILPPRDYKLKYTDSAIEAMYLAKEISTFKYNKWKADTSLNAFGDWQCTYCKYGPNLEGFSTCWSVEA